MKTIYFILLFSPLFSFSQVFYNIMQHNYVKAGMLTNGSIGYYPSTGEHQYEVPKGGGVHALYEVAPIYSASDNSGALYGNIPMYDPNSGGFPGPIVNDYNDAWVAQKRYNFFIYKYLVDYHMNNWDQPGYVLDPDIVNWPVNGNSSLGTSDYLAPFFDANGNGYYDPENGDYPYVLGELNGYSIFNYDSIVTPNISNPSSLPIEVNNFVYQFNDILNLEYVTFISHRVTNNSSETLFDFKWGLFTDFDLGNPHDDHLGTDSLLNLFYAYNGSNFDNTETPYVGYGENPPAIGVVSLNHKLHTTNNVTFGGGAYDINSLFNLHNIMEGNNSVGVPNVNSQGNETMLWYSGNPNDTGSESEHQLGVLPGDKKGVISLEPFDFAPGESRCFHFAIVYGRSHLGYLESVNELINKTEKVIEFYNDNIDYNCEMIVGTGTANLETIEDNSIVIYPNPASQYINIETPHSIKDIRVYSVEGKLIEVNTQKMNNIPVSHLSEGVYTLQITLLNGDVIMKKLHVVR